MLVLFSFLCKLEENLSIYIYIYICIPIIFKNKLILDAKIVSVTRFKYLK